MLSTRAIALSILATMSSAGNAYAVPMLPPIPPIPRRDDSRDRINLPVISPTPRPVPQPIPAVGSPPPPAYIPPRIYYPLGNSDEQRAASLRQLEAKRAVSARFLQIKASARRKAQSTMRAFYAQPRESYANPKIDANSPYSDVTDDEYEDFILNHIGKSDQELSRLNESGKLSNDDLHDVLFYQALNEDGVSIE